MNFLLANRRRPVNSQKRFGPNLNVHFVLREPGYLLALLLVISSATASGCHFRMHEGVTGSGNRQTQKRDIGPFTSISTEGAFDIDVAGQKPVSLEIEGDDNILPLITTDVSGGVLHIKSARNYSAKEPISIRISVPNIEGLSVTGAGTIKIAGLKNDKFEIDSKGAATISVSGETEMVSIDSSGAGKIDAHKLRAAKGVVESKGVASIEVNANEQLDVTISGPSHVVYEGDPKITKRINGPGSVEKKASGPA